MESIGLQLWPGVHCLFVTLLRQMAANKDTPKKFYSKRPSTERTSCCRLCKAVVDRRHSKDLFGSANSRILNYAQSFCGHVLRQHNALPHLICRPCERRLDNATKFKSIIEETQKSLESELRSKRCLDTSPSVTQPSKSRVCASTRSEGSRLPSRRSLQFAESSSTDVSDE